MALRYWFNANDLFESVGTELYGFYLEGASEAVWFESSAAGANIVARGDGGKAIGLTADTIFDAAAGAGPFTVATIHVLVAGPQPNGVINPWMFEFSLGARTITAYVSGASSNNFTLLASGSSGNTSGVVSGAYDDSDYHVFSFVLNGSVSTELYFDGVLVTSSTTGVGGTLQTPFSWFSRGSYETFLAQVEWYDTAQSASEVQATAESLLGIMPSVSWSAPADGGSPITGYVVRFLVDGEVVEQEVGPEVLSVEFPEGGTAAQVLAVNAVGFSTPVERVL